MKRITSRHHPLVARCRDLARRRAADADLVLLDGPHLIVDACRAGIPVETAAFESAFMASVEGAALLRSLEPVGAEIVEVADTVLAAMSPVASPSGVVAIARRPSCSLDAVLARSPQLVVVALDVQDPGNVGAMARAAEAGGATGLLLCGSSADPFGWKALRGSMGSLLRLPASGSVPIADVLAAIRVAGVAVVATVPRGGRAPEDVDLRGPAALLLGGEGPGLPDEIARAAELRVSIPMQPPVESLNVAVAAALLVYEAARQRKARGRHA